jgi:hypothetical protein
MEHSCDGNVAGSTLKVNNTALENLCSSLLTRYINNQESDELNCLYAIQKFVVDREHPPSIKYLILTICLHY